MDKHTELKIEWIVTISSSDCLSVEIYKFLGTEDEVKKYLFKLSNSYTNNNECILIYFPENEYDIEIDSFTGNLMCQVSYEEYDIVFNAKKLSEIEFKGMQMKD